MATYNGAPYIGAQIDSILAQTYRDWRLIIRDDNSNDGTVQICKDYVAKHPQQISLFADGLGRLKVSGNFSSLLAHCTGAYIMFSDQDDIWLPGKIEKTMQAMRVLEGQYGDSSPALVHTDSQVVNAELQMIAPSLLRYVHRKPNPSIGRLCMELPIYGHAVMINRRLKELGGRIPDGFASWDWWFPMVAVVFGHIRFVDEPLVLWRRHGKSYSSAGKHRLSSYLARSLTEHHKKVTVSFKQCEIFLERFSSVLPPKQYAYFKGVSTIRTSNWLKRRILIIRYGLFKTGLLKTAGVLLAA